VRVWTFEDWRLCQPSSFFHFILAPEGACTFISSSHDTLSPQFFSTAVLQDKKDHQRKQASAWRESSCGGKFYGYGAPSQTKGRELGLRLTQLHGIYLRRDAWYLRPDPWHQFSEHRVPMRNCPEKRPDPTKSS
jgi:hypothetical protein